MKGSVKLILAMAAFLAVAGCATVGDYADIIRPRALSQEYLQALDSWTREQTVYAEFATRARMVATLRGREFVEASLAEYERIYLVDRERRDRPHPAMDGLKDFTEILLYVYMPDRAAIDLDRRDSIWRAFLFSADGTRYEPREIREIRDVTPLVTEFYPYVNPAHGKTYRLSFDAEAAGASETVLPMKLVVTSVVARIELLWDAPD